MAALRTNFATITSLSELYFRYRRFILLVQTENVISMNYGSSSSRWKPWRWTRIDLILMMREIYINSNLNPLTKFTNTSKSTEFRDILPWNICQMIMKTIPVRYDKTGYSVVNLTESQWKLRQVKNSELFHQHSPVPFPSQPDIVSTSSLLFHKILLSWNHHFCTLVLHSWPVLLLSFNWFKYIINIEILL